MSRRGTLGDPKARAVSLVPCCGDTGKDLAVEGLEDRGPSHGDRLGTWRVAWLWKSDGSMGDGELRQNRGRGRQEDGRDAIKNKWRHPAERQGINFS